MKQIIIIVLAFALLAPTISNACCGGGRSYEDGLFWGADLNRNQYLDKNEAKQVYNLAQDDIFTRFDEDQNGFINRSEFLEFIQLSPWVGRFVHPSEIE